MSVDEQGLHIAITASAGTATDAITTLDARLAKLEQAFNKAGKGAENAGKEVEKAGGFFSKFKQHLEGIEQHAGNLGNISQKLGGMGDAFKGLSEKAGGLKDMLGAVPGPLMAVTAGLAAVSAGAAFMKDAADKAAAWQQSMDILGRTVRDSGANWNTAKKAVEGFADAQERATTYSRDDVVKAITQMTSAGMSYKDAMAEVRVAEDASAATGQSLLTVSHGLVEATHGRTQALTMLGIGTKQSIKQGMTLYQMNAAIEKQMGGSAAAAAQGYAGKMTQLHNAFETLQEKIGTAVLPVLTELADTLTHMVDAAETQFQKWEAAAHAFYLRNKQAFDAVGKVVRAVWTGIEDVTHAFWAQITGSFKAAFGYISDAITLFSDLATGHFDRLWGDVKNIFSDAFHNLTSGFGNFGDNLITIAERIAKAVAHAFEAPFSAMADAMHGNLAKAKADLAGTFSGFGGLTSGLKWDLGWGGGASHAEAAANPLLHLSAAAGNIMAGGGLGGAKHHHAGHHANAAAVAARKAEAAAIREIRTELQRYIATIDLEQKKHQITIQQEIADLKRYEATHKLTADERIKIEQKIQALEQESARVTQEAERKKQEAVKKTVELKKKEEEATKKAAEQQTRELQKQQAAWQHYYKTLEQNAQQWTDKTASWIDAMFQRGKKGVNSFAHEFKNILKEIEQALLKSALFEMFMGGQGAKGPSFMSVFAKNMGFGGGGAPAPGGSPMGGMAMGALSMLGGKAGGALSGITSMFGGGKAAAGGGNGSGGIIGALIGTSAATQLASSLPTDSLMSLMFGVGAPSMAGGLGGGGGAGGGLAGFIPVAAGAGGPGGGTILGALSGGSGGILSGLSGMGGGIKGIGSILGMHLGGPYIGATLGSVLLGAAGGYGIGSLIGNSGLFHGQNDASIGGAIGGGAGAFFGTALDAALGIGTGGVGLILGPLLGSIGGSLLGGLFGSHDVPANMPDKYDTANYLAAMSTLNGNANWHANGQTIANYSQDQQAYSALMSASGGQSGISWIEKTLAQYATPGTTQMGANTPDWLKPMWNQLVAAFGISSSGSGKMNWGHAINNEWITGASGVTNSSSKPLQYTDFMNMLNQFYQGYMTQGQVGITSPNAPTGGSGGGFNVTSPFAGAYVVGTPGSAPQAVSGSGLPTFSLGPDPFGGTSTNAPSGTLPGKSSRHILGTVNVTVNVAGNVTAENDLAEKIRKHIIDLEALHLNAHDMAMSGIGF